MSPVDRIKDGLATLKKRDYRGYIIYTTYLICKYELCPCNTPHEYALMIVKRVSPEDISVIEGEIHDCLI